MRTRTFEWAHSANGRGWKPVGMPSNFYAGEGHMVAHDVIEHVSNHADFDHELMAFGATLFGRMSQGDARMAQISSEDMANFLREQDYHVNPPPKTRFAFDRLPGDDEAMLKYFISKTRENIAMFGQRDAISAILFGISERTSSGAMTKEAMDNAIGWIRIGYFTARRLFRGHEGHQVRMMFRRMMGEINDHHDNEPEPKIGDTLTVNLDRSNLRFYLKFEPNKHHKDHASRKELVAA